MSSKPPLWPAHLHHFCLETPQLDAQVEWYKAHLEMTAEPLDGGAAWLSGRQRNLVLRPAGEKGFGFAAYALADDDQAGRFDSWVAERGIPRADLRSPVFTDAQTAVADPDGNVFVFGVPARGETGETDPLPGRLQHLGVCTPDIERMRGFYVDSIGYRLSDIVRNDDGKVSACFLRSDAEHHCLALFAASSSRFDHQCYETTCWNDIRDWGDHFADLRTEIEWGAARHGAGNNLFIFVRDLDGNPVELSAELETRDYDAPPGQWKTEARTLNLWGSAWTRD